MDRLVKFLVVAGIIIFLIPSCAVSQPGNLKLTTKNKKAAESYNKATAYFDRFEYQGAKVELLKAIKLDKNFIEAYMLMADVYSDLKEFDKSIEYYKLAIAINPEFFSGNYFNLANTELRTGRYAEAEVNFRKYLKAGNLSPGRKDEVERKIASCEFAVYALANPVPFNPVNMGDSINTPNDEYLPALTADENTLIITVRRPKDQFTVNQMNKEEEDFYISHRINGKWSKARFLGPPINTHGNEGAQCISQDGKFLIFTGCNRDEGYGSCDLYISERHGNKWGEPVNMGPYVNSPNWDSQPSLAPDGRTLYFASNRKGGAGNTDIWVTYREDDGWSIPVNLGEPINTPGQEMAPFIHPDGKTLYFSSNYHPGMGGMDLFLSRLTSEGKWGEPVNLGYPINTLDDEVNLLVNANGDYAYISSNRFGGAGKFDLFTFEMPAGIRPEKVNYMKGVVFNSETKEKLAAKFQLIDLENGKVVVESFSDAINGEFLVCLPTNKDYALNVSKDSYLFYSENFTISGINKHNEPFIKDIPLKPIRKDQSVVMRNIFFDSDKFDLKSGSEIELLRFAQLMNQNPKIKIEISGHTDNVGSDAHNLLLSENRAKAVYDFLVANGINKDRMTYKGYGKSKPIDTNESEEGRANNRRTEFKVIDL